MLSEIIDEMSGDITFPCLMKSVETDLILLVTRGTCMHLYGTVVASDGGRRIGHHSDNWKTHMFKLFRGKLVLEN